MALMQLILITLVTVVIAAPEQLGNYSDISFLSRLKTVTQDKVDKMGQKLESKTTILQSPMCNKRIKFVYVPPGSSMQFLSDKRKGKNKNRKSCGWWFWTDDDYIFKVRCEKLDLKSVDFMVVFDEDNDQFQELTNKVAPGYKFTIGDTNDLAIGLESDKGGRARKFKCRITTVMKPKNCQCGKVNTIRRNLSSNSTRIVGGAVVVPDHGFPWVVSLKKEIASTESFCQAVIITSEYLLTSAVCALLCDINFVALGAHDITDVESYITQRILQKTIHDLYEENTHTVEYNIAVLKTAKFELTTNIGPICLPIDASNNYAGVSSVVSGWGVVTNPTPTIASVNSPALKSATVTVVAQATCVSDFTETPLNGYINDYVLCAADPSYANYPCFLDGGAPLQYSSNGNVELIGILSARLKCNDLSFPDLYTRVTEVLTWIKSVTGETDFCPRV